MLGDLIREYISKDTVLIVCFVENVLLLFYVFYRYHRFQKMRGKALTSRFGKEKPVRGGENSVAKVGSAGFEPAANRL